MLPILGVCFGTIAGWCIALVLHWVLWGFGDWLLYPLARPLSHFIRWLPREIAPLMWAIVGAAAGLLLGIGRAFAAVGQGWMRYVIYLLLSLAFITILINAMVSPGA